MDTLRVGVIGTGVMGEDHARTLVHHVAGARLSALSDIDAQRRDRLARELGVPHTFDEGAALIHSGEVDAVVVAAPDRFHAHLVLECLEAGLPVLCEKPLAPTPEEVGAIVEVEAALERPLVSVGFMRRFDPGYLALRDRLAQGVHGRVLMTHSVHRSVEAYPGGTSVDTLTNSAIHEIDLLPWLTGSPIVRVEWRRGRATSLLESRTDPQFILLTDASGILHTVALQVHARYGYDVRCEVVCEEASIELPRVPALVEGDLLLVSSGGSASLPYPPDWRQRFAAAYRAELQAWVGATIAHRLPDGAAGAADALRDARVAQALVRSMDSGGQAQDVPEDPHPA